MMLQMCLQTMRLIPDAKWLVILNCDRGNAATIYTFKKKLETFMFYKHL